MGVLDWWHFQFVGVLGRKELQFGRGSTLARDSDNTKHATKYAVRTFRTYLTAKKVSVDFENFLNAELDKYDCISALL